MLLQFEKQQYIYSDKLHSTLTAYSSERVIYYLFIILLYLLQLYIYSIFYSIIYSFM